MANNIVTAVNWVDLLDAVYQEGAKTADLDSGAEVVRAGTNAGEFQIAKIDMDGLADYDRASGYTGGDVSLTWETHKHNFERGRMFTVDEMDDEESIRLTFANLAGEFVRNKVVPEIDAFRFATYAGIDGIGTANGSLTDGAAYVAALRAAITAMDNDQVPMEGRILYITSGGAGMIDDLPTSASRKVMDRFSKVVIVPQSRFYTAINQLDGVSTGEEVGGYTKAVGAADINFMIVHPSAVIQAPKHVKPKIVDPDTNQTADAWKFGYRNYGIASAYENKVAGIYCHHA